METFQIEDSLVDNQNLINASRGTSWTCGKWNVPKVTVLRWTTIALIAFDVCMLVLLICSNRGSTEASRICEKPGCIQQTAELLRFINSTADPCQDFYNYACGNFHIVNPSVDGVASSVQSMLELRSTRRLEDILGETNEDSGKSAGRKARDIYRSCRTALYRDHNYVADLVRLIRSLGGMQLFNNWHPEHWIFQKTLSNIHSIDNDIAAYFRLTYKQTASKIIISPASSLLSVSRPLYAKDPKKFIVSIMNLLQRDANSTCNTSCIEAISEGILATEISLRDLMRPAREDMLMNVTLNDLELLADHFPWKTLVQQTIGTALAERSTITIQTASTQVLTAVNTLLTNSSAPTVQNYLMWTLILQNLEALGPKYARYTVHFDYNEPLISRKQIGLYCIHLLSSHMKHALSALLLKHHIGQRHPLEARVLVDKLVKSIATNLHWMEPKTRNHFRTTLLRQTSIDLGAIESSMNQQSLDEYYAAITVNSSNFFQNLQTLRKFHRDAFLLSHRGSIYHSFSDKNQWMPSQTPANIDISYKDSTLFLSYTALQVPWFDKDNPFHVNAAGVGSLVNDRIVTWIAEELNIRPEYTASQHTLSNYSQCQTEQFRNYLQTLHLETTDPTPSRRLANQQLAFQLTQELVLPVEDSNSSDQLLLNMTDITIFYLTYTQARCGGLELLSPNSSQQETTRNMLNYMLLSSRQFQQAFNCPLSEKYNQCFLK